MDLDTLFYVALIAIYFIVQALSSRRRRKMAPKPAERTPARRTTTTMRTPRAEPARQPSGNQDLDEALAEIRRALGWEAPRPEPAPSPSKPPSRAPQQPAPRRARVESRPAPSTLHTPRDLSAGQRTIPKSRLETEAAEEAQRTTRRQRRTEQASFESVAPEWESPPRQERTRHRHLEEPAPAPRDRTEIRLPDLQRRLRNPATAREAFLISEIFGRRPHTRR